MKPIHGIREDGTVEGYEIETYFRSALRYERHEGEDVVRLIIDDEAVEIVTALPESFLRKMLDCLLDCFGSQPAERSGVPELTDGDHDDLWSALPGSLRLALRKSSFEDGVEKGYALAASRARALAPGMVVVSAEELEALRDVHKWAIHCGYEGHLMDRLEAIRAKREGET